MKYLCTFSLPALFLLITGCAASSGRPPEDAGSRERQNTPSSIAERVDRNTAEIRAAREDLAALRGKLESLEEDMHAATEAERAKVQEIKENISFLSDQLLRMDGALRGEDAPGPKGADVFKPNGFNVEASYKEALRDYEARRYEAAIGKFTEIVTVAPSSILADNAQYWIGESWYGMKEYDRSLAAFQKVLAFPKTNKAADATLKIGMIYQIMNNPDAAREELKTVLDRYPGTPAAKIASERLAELERK